ncbi:MAG: glycosyltransferase [Candidatus Zixiibacteriota bacterium]
MSRKALLICYYFPPLGLSGVARPLNLFQRLPQLGYECHVLTVKPVAYRAFEPELLESLDQSKIFRSGSYDPQRLLYQLGVRTAGEPILKSGRRLSRFFFPDSKIGWVGPAVRMGRKLIERHAYDVIVSTSPPMSCHLVAQRLARVSHLPWVADFRDFWTSLRVEQTFESQHMVSRGRDFLKSIKREAATITAVSQSIADYVGAATVITNGYDPEEAMKWRTPPASDQFRIGLLGTFNDLVSVEPLLKVVARLIEKLPAQRENLQIIQVGQVDRRWLDAQLDQHQLHGMAVCHGRRPRNRTVELLSGCSLFYIGLDSKTETSILPGRMFDLLASGRPILAHVPAESEIGRLVHESGAGYCFQGTDIETAVLWLTDILKRGQNGSLKIEPLPLKTQIYSWERIVERFAQVLDKTVNA